MISKTFIDNSKNDLFGKKIDIIQYPYPPLFNSSIYKKNIKHVQSFIRKYDKEIFIVIIKEIKNNIITSQLVDIIENNNDKSINVFVEDSLYVSYISHFPRIWYEGNIYLEVFSGNKIYGYIKIIFVKYSFMYNKVYKEYNSIII